MFTGRDPVDEPAVDVDEKGHVGSCLRYCEEGEATCPWRHQPGERKRQRYGQWLLGFEGSSMMPGSANEPACAINTPCRNAAPALGITAWREQMISLFQNQGLCSVATVVRRTPEHTRVL